MHVASCEPTLLSCSEKPSATTLIRYSEYTVGYYNSLYVHLSRLRPICYYGKQPIINFKCYLRNILQWFEQLVNVIHSCFLNRTLFLVSFSSFLVSFHLPVTL